MGSKSNRARHAYTEFEFDLSNRVAATSAELPIFIHLIRCVCVATADRAAPAAPIGRSTMVARQTVWSVVKFQAL
jgi:hypothetical protein